MQNSNFSEYKATSFQHYRKHYILDILHICALKFATDAFDRMPLFVVTDVKHRTSIANYSTCISVGDTSVYKSVTTITLKDTVTVQVYFTQK